MGHMGTRRIHGTHGAPAELVFLQINAKTQPCLERKQYSPPSSPFVTPVRMPGWNETIGDCGSIASAGRSDVIGRTRGPMCLGVYTQSSLSG